MADKSVWKVFGGANAKPGYCVWCGEELQLPATQRFYLNGERQNSHFCGHRCGHQFAECVARGRDSSLESRDRRLKGSELANLVANLPIHTTQ